MAVDLDKELDYESVFQAILDKTEEGKIVWQETADPATFIAAVKGQQTFRLTKGSFKDLRGEVPPQAIAQPKPMAQAMRFPFEDFLPLQLWVKLTVSDGEGKILFETPPSRSEIACALYQVAQRIANHIDERLERTLDLVNAL